MPRESGWQAVEALWWTVRHRPARYLSMIAGLLILSFAESVLVLWGQPWWLQGLVAVVVVVAATVLAFGIRASRPGRRTYASAHARLAIDARPRGWYVADHVARPHRRGEGRQFRQRVCPPLILEADRQRVVVFAHTTSEKLARAYLEDIPGLRIASVRGRRFLLVRPPVPSPPVTQR